MPAILARRREGPRLALGLISLIALLLGSGPAALAGTDSSADWWLRLRTSAYSFQSYDRGAELDRLGGYQHFDGYLGGLADDRLAFRLGGRFADDLSLKESVHDRERLHVAYVQARPATGSATRVRLGRQFLQEGPNSLRLDGLWFDLEPVERWNLHGWAGAQSPTSLEFESGSLGDDASLGLRLTGQLHRKLRLGLSGAYRESGGIVAFRPLGLEISSLALPTVRVVAQGAYDLEQEQWSRVTGQAQWTPGQDLPGLTLQYLDRRPHVEANSYFVRFAEDLERVRIARATAHYQTPRGIGGEVEYFGSFVEDRTASRVGAALIGPHLRVGYSLRVGDSGEEGRWYGDVNLEPLRWLTIQGGAALSTYALLANEPDSADRDLTTAFGRVQARLRRGMTLSAEVQSLESPLFAKDVRFLVGLDLFAGRGSSSFGLGTGGWLQ